LYADLQNTAASELWEIDEGASEGEVLLLLLSINICGYSKPQLKFLMPCRGLHRQ
jgi:hypothetical protein